MSVTAEQHQKNVELAKEILHGRSVDLETIDKLSNDLKKADAFGWSRRLLEGVREQPITDSKLRVELGQRHALCTYKDPDLPAGEKLDDALAILQSIEDLKTTDNQETLGLVGAIHKRKWRFDAHKSNLERSLAYYRRGYELGPETDYGYTGINAAYVLDLLAHLEREEAREAGTTSASASARRAEAEEIRRKLVKALPPLAETEGGEWLATAWWFLATIAEAWFGLDDFDEAKKWLDRAKALPDVPDWEFESTATQLASLAQLRVGGSISSGPEWQVLEDFLGDNAAAVQTVFAGKMGLGLSGGGFRASLFHLGLLARLAELDLLRHVHVLSCVSGGSILGAHYYLEVRRLLQRKADDEITQQDYIEIVERMIREFLAGVQRNIRMRVAANPWVNLRMLFSSTYSRTLRLGDLYESELYRRVEDGGGDAPRLMRELQIHPKGEPKSFNPRQDNWKRRNKVPILVLNATTLNTGHNWQFTTSWMGEPPGAIDTQIDGNQRLRRMYYGQAPEKYQNLSLGVAVGASACVPGLFEPIALPDLFPDMTIRLVDGGVHDNQGVGSLLEQNCTVVMVSDASGQMNTEPHSKGGVIPPLLRTNSTLMARVRTSQFQDLKARRRSAVIKGLMVIHLLRDLDVESLDWEECEEPPSKPARQQHPLTSYGVLKEMQELVAGIRTDLDSFSDIEAYALMASGYLQTDTFVRGIEGFPAPEAEGDPVDWPFFAAQKALQSRRADAALHDKVKKHLEVGAGGAFRAWKLYPPLGVLAWILAAAAVAGFGWFWWSDPKRTLWAWSPTISDVGWVVVVLLVGMVLGKMAKRFLQVRQTLSRIALALSVGLVGWLVASLHLHVFDRLALRLGRLR